MDTVDPRKDTVDQVDRAADQAAKAVDRMKVVAVLVVPDHTKARAEVHPVKEADLAKEANLAKKVHPAKEAGRKEVDLAKEAGPEKKVDPRPNVNWHKISPLITFSATLVAHSGLNYDSFP